VLMSCNVTRAGRSGFPVVGDLAMRQTCHYHRAPFRPEAAMTQTIACNDVMPGCQYKAENEQELMAKVARHAAQAHGITEITPDILQKVRGAIREA
jgi:predicted small metal-binding protein